LARRTEKVKLGRHDLSVAVRRNVAQPQALLTFVSHHVQDVFAIGRDGDQLGFAGFADAPNQPLVSTILPSTEPDARSSIACLASADVVKFLEEAVDDGAKVIQEQATHANPGGRHQ
jgi:hypothetical protein